MTHPTPVIEIHPTDIPGLFDVVMPDGNVRGDMTHGQVTWILMENPGAEVRRG